MFRIGEFAQISQVSGRQLRFYDQLGLLEPAHVDQQTGYRYYTVRQLPRLNSILALNSSHLPRPLTTIFPVVARTFRFTKCLAPCFRAVN
jgi:MerR HTH family regulatory protein